MEQYDILLRHSIGDRVQSSRLLAYANKSATFDGDADAWLCNIFGVAYKQCAAFSAMGDGLDARSGYWLRADPVHLALMRDFFVLQGTPADISPEHVAQMIEALNRHFSGNGMQWFAREPGRWYLRVDHALEIIALSKNQALGKRIDKDTSPAHSDTLLNEVQMLLHQQAVNMEREELGMLPVNSVWLWGGGQYGLSPSQPYTMVITNEPLTRGLAGGRCQPVPESAESVPIHGECLVVLDDMDTAQFEQKWAEPLLGMLKNNKLQKLVLHLEQETYVVSYEVRRRDLWKLWRRWWN